MITIILLIVLGVGILLFGFVVWRKLPQLRIVDPLSSQEEQAKQLKNELVRQRVERTTIKPLQELHRSVILPFGSKVQETVRKMAGKLVAAEKKYKEKQKQEVAGGMNEEMADEMLKEAKGLLDEGWFDRAEKKYIEVISAMPKYVKAYEGLGRLYLQKKEYDSASETFTFLSKLSKDDPSVIASLGEVEELRGNKKKAFEFFERAYKLSPKNPKYLDFYIDSCIENGDKHSAMTTIDELREVNPDNAKIEEFEERLKAM